jgi:hypothetical protein
LLPDLLRRLEAVHDGHRDVHQDHIGVEREGELHGLGPVARVARDLEPLVRGKNRFEGLAEQPVVVRDQHADLVRSVDGSLQCYPGSR